MKLISGAGEPVVNPPSVDKGITTLAVNINLNSYMENIKKRTLKALATFQTFSKKHYKHNRTKNC